MPALREGIDPANIGRRGRRWRDARAACFRDWGDTCVWCGHVGAGEVDHVIPRAQGGAPYDPANLRPIHGSNAPCPVCVGERTGRPRCCNQEKQAHDRRGLAMQSGPAPELWEFVTDVGSV